MDYIPPDRTHCAHCGEQYNPVFKVNEEAMVAIRTMAVDAADVVYSLCAICTLELGEFVEPSLKEEETWNRQKAEVIRLIRSARN